jgi:3-hydroxyisobutyrate dehydrogenase-like beta-hydroxyacid dehydrogenase
VNERIAFLGLGRWGARMAAHLPAAGHDVVVWNRGGEAAAAFAAEHGADIAATPAGAAAGAGIVIAMLADGDVLVEVFTGPDGVAEGIGTGAVAVDMGTSGPVAVAAVRERMLGLGADLVDAPVMGSTPAAEAATLQVMVGGEPASVERVLPVLEAFGTPVRVGPPGAGATLKLAANSLLLGINQALGEAIVLAEAGGVEPATMLDVIAGGAAGAPMITYRRPQYLDPDGAPVSFTLELARKDLGLALDRAASEGVPMAQAERTLEIIEELIASGEGQRDLGFVAEGVRRRRDGQVGSGQG